MVSKELLTELLEAVYGSERTSGAVTDLGAELIQLLQNMWHANKNISNLWGICQQAIRTGRLFYDREVTTEGLLKEFVMVADFALREYLRSQEPLPQGKERLRQFLVGAILELACVALGYQDEGFRILRILSETDPLTGLLSRERFQRELDEALEYAKRQGEKLTVVWTDVDDLKLINDLYGYAVGDAVLRAIAEVLREVFYHLSPIISRTGSNSFGIIIPGKGLDEVLGLAETLRKTVERQRPIEDDFGITVSIGISSYPLHGRAANDLVAAAEMATIKAKRCGKNRIEVLDVNAGFTDLTVLHEKSLILREALQRAEGVIPYFQPIVDIDGDKIIGYEVLARIFHQGRVLPAAAFAEVAEDIEVIHIITEKVLEKALWKFGQKNTEHLIFVNCSLREIERKDLVEKISWMLAQNGIRPDRLVIELTERQAVREIARVHAFAVELQSAGMRLALDDFGSGFSSFLYLRQFDCYFAKIEGSLIRDITRSARCKLIVEHIVALLRSLAVEPIAEWVETSEACNILKRFGVNLCQGYYLGLPSPEI